MKEIIYQDCLELMQARSVDLSVQPKQAIKLYEKAIKNNPTNLKVLQDACAAFSQRYELRKAHSCVERVLRLAKLGGSQVHLLAGYMNLNAYRPDKAAECFQDAIKGSKPQANAHVELTALYEKSGRYEEALEQAERALTLNANDGIALRVRADLYAKLGRSEEAESAFSALSKDERQSAALRAHALNGWANLLDGQEQYDAAFAKLTEGKALQLSDPNIAEVLKRYDAEFSRLSHVVDSVEAGCALSAAPESAQTPHYLLTGCPRSGTTLIEKVLDAHPEIISADEYNVLTGCVLPDLLSQKLNSEGMFGMQEINSISAAKMSAEAGNYRKAIELAIGEKIGKRQLIDKNPGLTGHIPLVLSMSANAKLIYALRDPRDIAISSLFRWLPMNTGSLPFLDPASGCSHIAQELTFWLKLREIIAPERWMETRYESTVANLEAEASGLLQWMGLDWQEEMNQYRDRVASRGVNSPTYSEVSKPIYTKAVERWRNYEQHMAPHFEHLEEVLAPLGYS